MKEGKDAKDSAEIRVKVDELLSYVESQQETDEEKHLREQYDRLHTEGLKKTLDLRKFNLYAELELKAMKENGFDDEQIEAKRKKQQVERKRLSDQAYDKVERQLFPLKKKIDLLEEHRNPSSAKVKEAADRSFDLLKALYDLDTREPADKD